MNPMFRNAATSNLPSLPPDAAEDAFSSPNTRRFSPTQRLLGFAVLLAWSLLASGCASLTGPLVNRPVVEDSIKNAISTVSLAADRRTVVVVTEGSNRTKFCAEPPPDTATALKSELNASLNAKRGELGVDLRGDDKFGTTVTVIADRTDALDAFRTGVYALCQYHLNGAISREDVRPLFEKLIESFAASRRLPRTRPPKTVS